MHIFFKSLVDAAHVNLTVEGNERNKIDCIFKVFAHSLKMAVCRSIFRYELPSTKEVLGGLPSKGI